MRPSQAYYFSYVYISEQSLDILQKNRTHNQRASFSGRFNGTNTQVCVSM